MRDCAEEIVNLATMISNESSADLAISGIIPRSDDDVLAVKVSGVNKILKLFAIKMDGGMSTIQISLLNMT